MLLVNGLEQRVIEPRQVTRRFERVERAAQLSPFAPAE
jgi:hypothetical protein